MAAQQRLFDFENPLKKRFGKEFFSTLPRVPGVYFMKGALGELLYVGKAKNLRARLYSYMRAKPEQVSRKVIRMIHLVRSIEWEACESESAALLRENALLRSEKPPFNVVNKHPESYYFVSMVRDSESLHFQLTTNPEVGEAKTSFGAFKGRRSVREGYAALLRLLWASLTQQSRFEFPALLSPGRRTSVPYRFEIDFSQSEHLKTERLLRRFLAGTSRSLLPHLTEKLLANETIPPFIYRCIQDDLENLELFYERGPHRNRRLKRHHRLATHSVIRQEELDDLIVVYRSSALPSSS